MTDSDPTPNVDSDASIAEKTERLDEIVEQLEDGDVSLERADELHAEGQAIIDTLRAEMDLGGGSVTLRE